MRKYRASQEVGELNLLPIMNLISLLIPFLLLSAQFIQIGIILIQTPRLKSQSSADKKQKKKALNLTVIMTGKGYYVKSRFGSECPPGKAGGEEKLCFRNKEKGKFTADTIRALQLHLWYLYKRKYGSSQYYEDEKMDHHSITLVPQHDVKYEAVVKTLDALREIPAGAKDPPSPTNMPASGCRMTFDKKAHTWMVQGAKGEDVTERACMYHLVTLAIGAS
ncbi:MAG: biopolymer transporter ExbD [Deltaproteobacteria bacterium]|nr:biopolymer transporter ExbD [Deltaproteobacteria bacterium]